jgi:polyribonucleotide nucleotidyltransferase
LTLGSLSTAQRDAAMHMIRVLLNSKGYEKVLEIMGSDQALSDSGTPFSSGIASYTVGIFGQPSLTSPWMLQYGGHHLALNITIAGSAA